jgi:hypothetical protein
MVSIPNFAEPLTLPGESRRFAEVPMIFQSFASLSGTLSGTGRVAALSASWPYESMRPLASQ